MAHPEFRQLSGESIASGTNASNATLPAKRFVAYGSGIGEIDSIATVGADKTQGITLHDIEPGRTGDVAIEGVVPLESDGTAPIARGDLLVPAENGRAKTATGENPLVTFAIAETDAAAVAGAIVMVRIERSVYMGTVGGGGGGGGG